MKTFMFFVSDMTLTRLASLCLQLWTRHAVPHAPLSHVPAAGWAGRGRGDGEGAHSPRPRGSFFPCSCILQSPVHSHSHPFTPGGDAADAPGRTWQPWTQVHTGITSNSVTRSKIRVVSLCKDVQEIYLFFKASWRSTISQVFEIHYCFQCFSPLTSNPILHSSVQYSWPFFK